MRSSKRRGMPMSTATTNSAIPISCRIPIAQLLDKAYAAKIRASIPEAQGDAFLRSRARQRLHEGNQTTHYSIADAQGNAVAVTYTLNDWFGAQESRWRHWHLDEQ